MNACEPGCEWPSVVGLAPITLAHAAPVIAALEDVRFVGGCVRDSLLGRAINDIDLATPLLPHVVMARLTAAGVRVIPTGLAHGTVSALVEGVRVEITTLRRDVACNGRHAEVAFTDDWEADAARRDFTINALSCTADGRLYDPCGGVGDLMAGRVRFIGSAVLRIQEDVLRLLRFFRFHARYGRTPPDAEALEACRALAPLLAGLSGERVRTEVFTLLDDAGCAANWTMLRELGVAPYVLPVPTCEGRLGALVSLEAALGLPGVGRTLVRLAALLGASGVGAAAVAERLRLSGGERSRLVRLTAPDVPEGGVAESTRLRRALVRVGDARLFCDRVLLAASAAGTPPEAAWSALGLAARWAETRFPLTGRDILALGVLPGPAVGRLLKALEMWWADHDFQPDREACLAEGLRRLAA